MKTIIKGKKIILRPLRKEDFSLIYQWINNPRVMPFWYGRDKPRSKEWVKNKFTKMLDGNETTCFIIETNNKLIGFIYNTPEMDDQFHIRKVVLDILIGEPDMWGKGYGTDALRTMICYAFDHQGAERIYLTPRTTNARSVYVYEKLGFKKEGIMRHFELFEGKWEDSFMMAIIKEDWKKV